MDVPTFNTINQDILKDLETISKSLQKTNEILADIAEKQAQILTISERAEERDLQRIKNAQEGLDNIKNMAKQLPGNFP